MINIWSFQCFKREGHKRNINVLSHTFNIEGPKEYVDNNIYLKIILGLPEVCRNLLSSYTGGEQSIINQ